jgi:hypothetical protein
LTDSIWFNGACIALVFGIWRSGQASLHCLPLV